jgi:tyrosine-protein phosphatase SIW14
MRLLLAAVLLLTGSNVFAQNNIDADDLPRLSQIDEGLFRGGLPTEKGMKKLKELGIKTIVNIESNQRRIEQERAWAKKFKIDFISIPMDWQTTPSDEMVNEVLTHMLNLKKHPVYLHCRHGKDRTGLLAGLYRVEVQGWEPEKAYREMLEIGFDPGYIALKNYFWERVK